MVTDEWWVGGPIGLSLLILQWSIVLVLFYRYNDWLADLIVAKPFVEPTDDVPKFERVEYIEVPSDEYVLFKERPE